MRVQMLRSRCHLKGWELAASEKVWNWTWMPPTLRPFLDFRGSQASASWIHRKPEIELCCTSGRYFWSKLEAYSHKPDISQHKKPGSSFSTWIRWICLFRTDLPWMQQDFLLSKWQIPAELAACFEVVQWRLKYNLYARHWWWLPAVRIASALCRLHGSQHKLMTQSTIVSRPLQSRKGHDPGKTMFCSKHGSPMGI